ncbi:MAG: hypothetical protein K6F04_04030 [bacterium]|nr:hypothetical protein [bacterium]
MTKKISILAIIFSGILSTVSYADDTNTGKDVSEKTVTQGDINNSANSVLPATNMTTAITASKNATGLKSTGNTLLDSDLGWGTSVVGEDFQYKNGTIVSCDGSNGKCTARSGAGDNTNCPDKEIPAGFSCNAEGYLEPQASVVYNLGTNGKFYRFWQTVNKEDYDDCSTIDSTSDKYPCECELGKMGGCWSPSYPIVAFEGFNLENFKNLANDPNAAASYFGARTKIAYTESVDEENQYARDKKANGNYAYRMRVKVKPETVSGVSTGNLHNNTEAVLSVQSWTDKNGGLDPNFNYSSLPKDGSKGLIDNSSKATYNLSDITDADKKGTGVVLPCGMFTETTKPTGVYTARNVVCSDGLIRRTKDNSGNTLYTKYKVYLPTGANSYEETSSHDLNVRACASCETMENSCSAIISELIDRGYNTLDSLLAQLRKPTLDIALYTSPTARTNAASTGRTSNDTTNSYATYKGTLTCSTCLGYLDKLLPNFAGKLNN